tara:strand:+ start:1117 stop:1578 length:462 start_codon:yes stop_codon:yes gene_type:complete
MNKNKWGPIIWNFIHVLSYKIKNDCFSKQRKNLIDIIRILFSNLPCPYCSQHARKLLKQSNMKYIVDKESFIDYLFAFHNNVNKRLKKEIFIRNKMDERYIKRSLTTAINELAVIYNTKQTNNLKFMMNNYSNKTSYIKVINIIRENKEDYIL